MLTSDADTTSRLTARRWNASTSNGSGSLQTIASGARVRLAAPLNVSLRFVPAATDAPSPDTPTYAAENTAGALPRIFDSFTRSACPDSVGRTISRTDPPLKPSTPRPTLCAAAHAENHPPSPLRGCGETGPL